MATLTFSDIAALRNFLDNPDNSIPSVRVMAAAVAMHGLLASGAAEKHGAEKVAKVAYDVAEAFLVETVARTLPSVEVVPT